MLLLLVCTSFHAPAAYTGDNCEIGPPPCEDTDDCTGHFVCTGILTFECLEFWTGDDCTIRDWNVTTMGPDPACPDAGDCFFDGQCFNGTCCCEPGYTGERCETEILECESSPCNGNGDCIEMVNGFNCVCFEGKSTLFHPIN